jgi:hypothetical protein
LGKPALSDADIACVLTFVSAQKGTNKSCGGSDSGAD